MKVRLENTSGQIKEVKVGFSWTTFFFFLVCATVSQGLEMAGNYDWLNHCRCDVSNVSQY